MGASPYAVDTMAARVAARALARDFSRSLDEEIEDALSSMPHKGSRRKWLMRASKRVYRVWKNNGRDILWYYHEARTRKWSATAGVGYVTSVKGHLFGGLEVVRQKGNSAPLHEETFLVIMSKHAAEALFRKAKRLDRAAVMTDVRQLTGSFFLHHLLGETPSTREPLEFEVITEHGLALAIADHDDAAVTITTWVPRHQLRYEQLQGWNNYRPCRESKLIINPGSLPLPRPSTSIHRSGLRRGIYASRDNR